MRSGFGSLRHRNGVTRNDLITVLVILAVVLPLAGISILLPSLGEAKERANRIKCASNLRQIGQFMVMYAKENGERWPRGPYDPTQPAIVKFDSNGRGIGRYGDARPNNPAIAMYLLVRETGATPDIFICPSTSHSPDRQGSPKNQMNFAEEENLSYSIANPYPRTGVGVKAGYVWTTSAPPMLAIAADRCTGEFDPTATANSPSNVLREMRSHNHSQEGQNVLFANGHAEWAGTVWCGDQNDNVYTSAKVGASSGTPQQLVPAASGMTNYPDPSYPADAVLVPRCSSSGGGAAEAARMLRAWLILGSFVAWIFVIAMIVVLVQRRRQEQNMLT
jgi:hypothetical protein